MEGRRVVLCALLFLGACSRAPEPFTPVLEKLGLPGGHESVRFAVLGDTGTGTQRQRDIAARAVEYREEFAFDFVLMLGDNLYGREQAEDFERKFSLPYKVLLDDGVEFYAVLGNHDNRSQRFFAPFHMNGQSYYTFRKGSVRFFGLESDYMTPEQLAWLDEELADAGEDWKICFMHHPLYSSGATHGPSLELRRVLEPLFVRYAVDVVFAGHEHSYERQRPQQGVTYFVAGASAKLSPGNVRGNAATAASYDRDNSFLLVEVDNESLWFRAVSRTGAIVDSGVITHPAGVSAAEQSGDEGDASRSVHRGTGP